jgi:hypothetical protein
MEMYKQLAAMHCVFFPDLLVLLKLALPASARSFRLCGTQFFREAAQDQESSSCIHVRNANN